MTDGREHDAPPTLWEPRADADEATRLGQFMRMSADRTGHEFDNYDDLWAWSVGDGLEQFWAGVWDFFQVSASQPFERILDSRIMPGAQWLPGARLNYAENALRWTSGRPQAPAIVSLGESRERSTLSWSELARDVAAARAGLRRLGIGVGDRVAAYLPNVPETVVAYLATISLGAIWTSCAPEFGTRAVLERLRQVAPAVLLAIDGYRYGGRVIGRVEEIDAIRSGLPDLRHTVVVSRTGEYGPVALPGTIPWSDLIAETEPLEFAQVPADHPMCILYSSGTTGPPKAIVHGHGGLLLEHLKVLGLHGDLGPDDRFFWFTTTGWMMWNYLIAGLLHGTQLVLYDGDPNVDGPMTLWRLAAAERVSWFGVGSPFLSACARDGIRPRDTLDLSSVRAIGATGAPLPAEAFVWVYDAVSPDVLLSPVSGGTDVCSAFVGGSPLTPVWAGEIPCRYLGAAVHSFDERGQSVVGVQGELVVTAPMPSMPVGFWGDADGSRFQAAYFETYPGVWRHGDWITITQRGTCVISGRSDATLNRGGIRVGTAEIYSVVQHVPGVTDSLVVHLEAAAEPTGPGTIMLFVVLDGGRSLDEALIDQIRRSLRVELSPRHTPDVVHQIPVVPTTRSGKKLEIPVKRILLGAEPANAADPGSLSDPTSLDAFTSFRLVGGN